MTLSFLPRDCHRNRMNDSREDQRGGSSLPEAARHQNPVVSLPVELQAGLSLSRLWFVHW